MEMIRKGLVSVALVALLAPAPAAAQIDTSTEEGKIGQALRNVRLAHAADDIDAVISYYWKDPRLTVIDPDDGFKITGWGEWKQYLEDQRSLKRTLVWRTRHRNVHVKGDGAFVTFYVTRHVQFGKTVFKKNERGTYVLRKIDGTWLIVAQHISAFPPMLKFQQTAEKQGNDIDFTDYYSKMEEDIAVYDPATPWIYDGKENWIKRVEQMKTIRHFLDLNQFNRTEVEWDDMKVATVDREIRRPEGSFTERNHGRITWVFLKQPDGEWFYWHDHTSEIPEDFTYQK